MKKFTNNFKQFTSRLSARWLIMALMMLVGTSSVWGKTIYFKANGSNNWAADNAVIQISIGSNTSWKKMTSLGDGMYSYEANNGATVYFARGASEGSTWNITGKLTVPSDKNLFTPNGWSNCTGDWSTYTPPTTYTGTIKFKRPSAWNNVPCIHMFYDGNNTLINNQVMTSEGVDASGNTWYKYDYSITTTFTTATIMFNNGGWGNGQTAEQFKGDLGTDYCLASATSTTSTKGNVTSVDCPVFCTTVNVPNVTSDGPICAGSTATLTLNNPQDDVTYRLNSTTGDIIFSTEDTYTTPVLNTNTTYTIYASHDDACEDNVEGPVTVTVNAEPKIILTQETETICKGNSITLANYIESNIGTVTWYTDQAMTKTAAATVSPTANATYYAKAVNSPCAAATAQLAVTVNDKPAVPTLSADKTSLIDGDKAVFTVGNTVSGLTYTLYNGENAGESQTSTGSDLTFEAGEDGSYTVKVTNGCGTSTSTPAVEITVCTPQTNEFRHANSNYAQLQDQPTYYPGDKAYFVSTITCCLTGTWSNNLDKGVEAWYTDLTGGTPRFYMTLTRAGNFTITNMATNGCTQDKNVLVNLDFTITALSEVTNANGTASGADIALTWNNSANHSSVMVVRYPSSGTETIPAGGQAYTAGNTLGGGTVVYVGTAESYTDKNLPAGASYKYYFYTVNNNYYSEGVVLNMSSCPTPAKPSLSSTAITACNGECTAQGYITINNMNDYKDDTYTFELGSSVVTPDANGSLGINSTAYTQYTVTVTNSCGNSNSTEVEIAINDKTPTITASAAVTQPNVALTLNSAAGDDTEWEVYTNPNEAGSITNSKGASVNFIATEIGEYVVKATNGDCSFNFTITVADAFYIWVRNAKEGETAYANFYYPNENSEAVRGGEMFYAECDALPTQDNYKSYNEGGRKADVVQNDCDGYTWYGFKASADVIAGTKYFYVRATNDLDDGGYYTHSKPLKSALPGDVYYTLGTTGDSFRGWNLSTASAPYAGPVVHSLGSTTLGTDEFAALYVTDCSGKEITGYQWNKDGQPYSSVCSYVGKKGEENSDAGNTNNIRPTVAGNYSCTVTYGDETTATSAAVEIDGTYNRSFTSTIPVLVVNTGDEGFPGCVNNSDYPSKHAETLKAKRSVDVKIYDGTTLVYDRKARMAYRGSSSLNFTKKSYAFCPGKANCGDEDKGADYVKTEKLNMLGVGDAVDKDWVLYAAAADPSLMRNRMVFDTYQAMRPNDWGVHSRYVELIVDGEYKGVYVFMDKITMNENRVEVNEDNGFIVKFDKTDCADRVGGYGGIIGDEKTFSTERTGRYGISTYHTTVDQLFEIEYPEKDDYPTGWANKVASIKEMFQAFEDALEAGDYATVQKYIDYDSWADWFIINEFTKNLDAYRASCIFVYTGEAGAKIEARPLWDQELSFNNAAANISGKGANSTSGLLIQNDGVYTDCFPAPFWFTGQLATFGTCGVNNGSGAKDEKLANCLLNDPCFVQVVKEKWNQHQLGALSAKELNALVTKYTDELGDAALDRESDTWSDNFRTSADCNAGGTGYNEVSYSKSKTAITNWIADGAGGRREGLTTAINGLTGASFSIQILPSEVPTTPWEPVEIAVSVTPAGYDYKLEYTDNDLGSVANTIIEEEGDKIIYRIPRPDEWGTGDESVEGERTDIEYGIKATLNVQDGTTVCGSQAAPSSTSKIILQDEDNEKCPQP